MHVPEQRVVFDCTPMGWTGSYDNWFKCLDLIQDLDPEVVVPGHGPVCGIEGVTELRAYLEYVRAESKKRFDDGVTSLAAAKEIELGPLPGSTARCRRSQRRRAAGWRSRETTYGGSG